jgi:creatinine amidohydrolase/Fe(II)-dependent formamide hydrolase-like protein
MVLGKHNLVARHLAARIARELGDALVYPVLPFAPTGDLATRSGHMRFPGSVSLREDVYGAVIRDLASSAVDAGFRNILIMGDHGEGQKRLAEVAQEMDKDMRPHGVRVVYVDAVYTQAVGEHAGREDTSMLMAVEGGRRGVRKEHLGEAGPDNGAASDPRGASVAEGQRLLDARVRAAVRQIRELLASPS